MNLTTVIKHTLRKTVLELAAIVFSMSTFAQDIIVTTDARKIEAKITEVSKSEIRYKEKDYLDGPTFVVSTNEISSIIYANGKVVLYNQPSASAPAPAPEPALEPEVKQPIIDESAAEIALLSGHTITAHIVELRNDHVTYSVGDNESVLPASQLAKVTFLHNGQVKVYNQVAASVVATPQTSETRSKQSTPSSVVAPTSGRIYRDNDEYMHNERYISKKEVARILEKEDKAAYKQWKKAEGMLIGGAVCTGIGGGLVIGGLVSLATGDYVPCLAMECCALVPLGIGLGLCLGASSNYNKAIDIYNSKYDQAAVQLQWRIAPNGVGLAIAF